MLSSIVSCRTGGGHGGGPETGSGRGRTERNIHIFKLDLQHLTGSGESVSEPDAGLFTPPLLRIVWEQINGGAVCIFVSVLIARPNIKDV